MSQLADLSSYSIRNFISFMDEVYFRLFERQFEAWWPAHMLMLALGVAVIILAGLGKNRAVALALAIPFAFSALTFHFQLYAELTPVGKIFGWAFLIQIPITLIWGFATKSREKFRPRVHTIIGALIAVFGLLYPVLALLAERKWSGAEYFGMAPDPTVCFFCGIALICARPVWLVMLLPIPFLWTIATWGTLDNFDAPFAITLPIIAVITAAAGIWRAVFHRRSDLHGQPQEDDPVEAEDP